MRKLTFASFKEVGLTGAGAIAVTHVHFTKDSLCLPCMFWISADPNLRNIMMGANAVNAVNAVNEDIVLNDREISDR